MEVCTENHRTPENEIVRCRNVAEHPPYRERAEDNRTRVTMYLCTTCKNKRLAERTREAQARQARQQIAQPAAHIPVARVPETLSRRLAAEQQQAVRSTLDRAQDLRAENIWNGRHATHNTVNGVTVVYNRSENGDIDVIGIGTHAAGNNARYRIRYDDGSYRRTRRT